jgi:hypothetical protein
MLCLCSAVNCHPCRFSTWTLRFTWCRIDPAIVAHARFVPRDIDVVFMTPEQAEVRIHSRRMSS